MQRPFHAWTESRDPQQHPSAKDEGCYNFMTGAGGWVQSLIHGYGGARVTADGARFRPQLPPSCTRIKLRGLRLRGATYSVERAGTVNRVCAAPASEDGRAIDVRSVPPVPARTWNVPAGSCATVSDEFMVNVA